MKKHRKQAALMFTLKANITHFRQSHYFILFNRQCAVQNVCQRHYPCRLYSHRRAWGMGVQSHLSVCPCSKY